jgi:hypothetical protein
MIIQKNKVEIILINDQIIGVISQVISEMNYSLTYNLGSLFFRVKILKIYCVWWCQSLGLKKYPQISNLSLNNYIIDANDRFYKI